MSTKRAIKQGNGKKWLLIAIAAILILALGVGLCVALVRSDDDDITTFNTSAISMSEFTTDAVKDCKIFALSKNPQSYGDWRLLLLSYEERTKESVLIFGFPNEDIDESGEIEDDERGGLLFLHIYDVEEDEVAELSSFATAVRVLCEKDFSCSQGSCENSMFMWANMGLYLMGEVGDISDNYLPLLKTPSAHLQFDAEGTYKPSEKVMNILTGEV